MVPLQAMIKIMQEKIEKLIIKAVLEQNSDKNSLVECIQLRYSFTALLSSNWALSSWKRSTWHCKSMEWNPLYWPKFSVKYSVITLLCWILSAKLVIIVCSCSTTSVPVPWTSCFCARTCATGPKVSRSGTIFLSWSIGCALSISTCKSRLSLPPIRCSP